MRILQRDDILSTEFIIADKIAPHLGFDVQPLDRLPGEYIPSIRQSYEVCIICEYFKCDRVHHFPIIVLRELQLHQICRLQWLAIDGIRAMLQKPGQDVIDIEDGAIACTERRIERLQRYCAEVEGKPFERRAISQGFGEAGACAGGESIGRGPFAVSDLVQC